MSVTHNTNCLLCPPEKPFRIISDPMPNVESGQPPPEAVGRYVQKLREHLEKRHQEVYLQSFMLGQILSALAIIDAFKSTDPGVARGREVLRRFVHRLTRKNDPEERDLLIRSERILELDPITVQGIEDQLRDYRDYLLEQGEYEPKVPEQASQMVTP